MTGRTRAELYSRYPLSSVLIYQGSTILHFLLGGFGIILGYGYTWIGYLCGALYLALAFGEMYVAMPLTVCPSCVYYRSKGSLCISGLNVVSRRVAEEGSHSGFSRRAEGLLCPNNLYMAALVVPIVALIPALVMNPSLLLLVVLLALVALLLFRFFVIFSQIACVHCRAKFVCPQAGAMGVRDR